MPSSPKPVHSLYVLKAAGAFAVVMLHTSFILKIPLLPLLRLAVPLFFMITGYFLWSADRTQTLRRIRRTAVKIFWITLLANAVYASFLLLRGEPIDCSWRAMLRLLLYGDNFCGQLWYMNACIEALLIIGLFVKLQQERWLFRFMPVLLLLGLALGKYAWVWGLDALPEMSRNGLLTGLPFVLCGCMLRRREERSGENSAPPRLAGWSLHFADVMPSTVCCTWAV